METVVGLQRLTLKHLNTRITNSIIVGIIIGKQNFKAFSDKKDGNDRAVWNFTFRDSVTDYINVTCWGSKAFIIDLDEKFHIGDVVDILNAKIEIRHIDDYGEQFRPAVTSPFTLTLNERVSSMMLHEGENESYSRLLHYPTKPSAISLTLADISANGGTIRGDHVDLLVAVASVAPIRPVQMKNENRVIQKRDIIVLDRTHPGIAITLWQNEMVQRAESWRPRYTILFLADVRVDWSDFQKAMSVSFTSRTLVTEDPDTSEARALREHALSAPLHRTALLDRLASDLPPELAHPTQPVTVRQVLDRSHSTTDQHFVALLLAFPTHLDLDGPIQGVVSTRCERCDARLDQEGALCINLQCPVGSGAEPGASRLRFHVRIDLTDHTGTLVRCRLAGAAAVSALGLDERSFLELSPEERSALKWKMLFERCEVRVLVLRAPRPQATPAVSILSMQVANHQFVATKFPLY